MNEKLIEGRLFKESSAVAELNHLPGFDIKRFLKKTPYGLDMELKYKKLWFRMRHPLGDLVYRASILTDQIAAVEARVYLNHGDPAPISTYTAACSKDETPHFIRIAQDMAMNQALTDAGFGIQFCDAQQTNPAYLSVLEEQTHQEIMGQPATPTQNVPSACSSQEAEPAAALKADAEYQPCDVEPTQAMPAIEDEEAPVKTAIAPTASANATLADTEASVPVEQAQASGETTIPLVSSQQVAGDAIPTQVLVATESEDASVANTGETVLTALPSATAEAPAFVKQEVFEERTSVSSTTAQAGTVQAAVTQFAAMQSSAAIGVEAESAKILEESTDVEKMTLAEALAIKVDVGICEGWTLGEVQQRRQASLRWYLNNYSGGNPLFVSSVKIILANTALLNAS